MSKKNNKSYRSNGGKNNRNKQEITLPYSFIPFPKEFYYPYTVETLPKHDSIDNLTGSISYTIIPKKDLFVETRKNMNNDLFLSGSMLRGVVRSNVEILSASYPEFIDRTQILYRNLTDGERYLEILKENEDAVEEKDGEEEIEKTVRVGYLRKQGDKYYVIPAKRFNNGKNFTAIKEHFLYKMKVKKGSLLYKSNCLKTINEKQEEIDKLTDDIKRYRQSLEQEAKDEINYLFLKDYKLFNFRKKIKENRKHLDRFEKQLCECLKSILEKIKNKNDSESINIDDFSKKYAKRWRLKAEIDFEYGQGKNRNNNYKPYQTPVWIKVTSEGNVKGLSSSDDQDGGLIKGCLFNSTTASSKRSHYIIREPNLSTEPLEVPQSVINAYEKMRSKMRKNRNTSNETLKFYDLFDEVTSPNHQEKSYGYDSDPVVFFQVKKGADSKKIQVGQIGRTPYFKVPYDYQISELIGDKDRNQVDFASALFGYVEQKDIEDASNNDEQREEKKKNSSTAFKSRVRFSPIDFIGNPIFSEMPTSLLLPTPSASAASMYVKQKEINKLTSFENRKESKDKPELNGYKYYHTLEEKVTYTSNGCNLKMESNRKIVKNNGDITLKGNIYFTNLTKAELGLLLLGIDVTLFNKSTLFAEKFLEKDLNECYESIGGGKPYGYGKVQIKVDQLALENCKVDFNSLMLEQEEKKTGSQLNEYIEAFIEEMQGKEYFEKIHLANYIKSKEVFNGENEKTHYNWTRLSKEGKIGYDNNWRLLLPNTKR